LPEGWRAFFYRTSAGAELDLVLIDEKNKPVGVEIKYSSAPAVSKGFWNSLNDIGCKRGFIVYPGNESYPAGKNVVTIPFRDISQIWE
jgi:predicted AAA+ superfamily ATPase